MNGVWLGASDSHLALVATTQNNAVICAQCAHLITSGLVIHISRPNYNVCPSLAERILAAFLWMKQVEGAWVVWTCGGCTVRIKYVACVLWVCCWVSLGEPLWDVPEACFGCCCDVLGGCSSRNGEDMTTPYGSLLAGHLHHAVAFIVTSYQSGHDGFSGGWGVTDAM